MPIPHHSHRWGTVFCSSLNFSSASQKCITVSNEGWTSSSEFSTRYALEDEVGVRGIGRRLGAGSGGGWMDFNFAVDNVDTSLTAFIELLNEAGQLDQS